MKNTNTIIRLTMYIHRFKLLQNIYDTLIITLFVQVPRIQNASQNSSTTTFLITRENFTRKLSPQINFQKNVTSQIFLQFKPTHFPVLPSNLQSTLRLNIKFRSL